MNIIFLINNILIGIAIAMDAFSVSVANILIENNMKKQKMLLIAFVYAIFQFAMPIIGYICIKNFANVFVTFRIFVPYISLVLLMYIGIKMIVGAIRDKEDNDLSNDIEKITFKTLILQGVATSIDALSVGFTLSDYTYFFAFVAAIIIGVVTFIMCMCGLVLGKSIGKVFEKKAQIFGGIVLIIIGIEIFIKGIFFN